MTYWFDRSRLVEAVNAGLQDGLNEIGDRVAANARQRAPIRKAFREAPGFRRKFRPLSEAEKRLATERANRYYTNVQPDEFKRRRAVAHIRSYARVELPRRGSANAAEASRKIRILGTFRKGRFEGTGGTVRSGRGFVPGEGLKERLTSRGRYEVRTGRSVSYSVSAKGTRVRARVGGKLKASIENDGVVQAARGYKVTIGAHIRYAKYVEFPTIRTAAQPFLLPALHQERGRAASTIADAIRKNLGG